MWAKLNSDGDVIEEIITRAKDMLVDGINYPKVLFTLWTDAERLAINIVPVTTTGSHLDTSFYVEKDPTYAIANDKESVVRTIGVKQSDKTLADLKTAAKVAANIAASNLLKGYGWLAERKVTADVDVPSDVLSFMAAIRTDHANILTAIDNASDMDAFIALHTNTFDENNEVDVVARVSRWTSDADANAYRR
jgi:hypothetical protein|tara:strand:+ start:416 stop:994 length:579 start_codon:yes stop_codon:yes gene_type:complete